MNAAQAIARSKSHDEIVHVTVDSADDYISELTAAWDGDVYSITMGKDEDGRTVHDVWGWDDSTAEGRTEWRVYVIEDAAPALCAAYLASYPALEGDTLRVIVDNALEQEKRVTVERLREIVLEATEEASQD